MTLPLVGVLALLDPSTLPFGVDLSWLPVGTDVLLVLAAAWVVIRVAVVWVWLRRRGHLDTVTSAVSVLG